MRAHFHVSAVVALLSFFALLDRQVRADESDQLSKPVGSGHNDAEKRASEAVERALVTEAAGQIDQRAALLEQALELDPGYAPAHWQAGQVRWQGKWQSVDAVTHAAAADPLRAEYARLRSRHTSSAEAERELAQWCIKHKFDVEAKYHLRELLEFAPDDALALRELGLHAYDGELLTKAEIATRKKAAESRQRGLVHWKPRLTAWQRDLDGADKAKRDEALSQIQAITDVEVIPAFEAVLAELDPTTGTSTFSREMIGVLGRMQDARATFALVREAALDQWPDARDAAVAELKRRDMFDYVPYTLGTMSTLYESKIAMTVDPNGTVHYRQNIKSQRADSDEVGLNKTTVAPVVGKSLKGARVVWRAGDYARGHGMKANEARWMAFTDALNLAKLDEAVVRELNRVTDARNAAICRLLVATTGTDQGDDPRAWWDWWISYNELHYSPERRVHYYGNDSTYYDYTPAGPKSCFIAGTPVYTLTGLQPIESIQPGDRVLAQDPQTGELGFKTVLQTTLRPTSPTRKLRIGAELIVATRGHRFWQVGRGWQMAKQLQTPATLHGLGGALPLESAEDGDDAEAHNLVVADFHTYFVGMNKALVHDNSAPKPLLGMVPGLVEKATPTVPADAPASSP